MNAFGFSAKRRAPTIRSIRVTGIPEGAIEEGAAILAEALGIDLESEH